MILFPINPQHHISRWVNHVYDVQPVANDDAQISENDAWLCAFFHSNQNTAEFITHCLTKIARGDKSATLDLEDWVTTLDILGHNYKMTRRNVYTDND